VHVDAEGVAPVLNEMARELPIKRGAQIIERVHEDAAKQVDDQDACILNSR
jgi:hypothetical protein